MQARGERSRASQREEEKWHKKRASQSQSRWICLSINHFSSSRARDDSSVRSGLLHYNDAAARMRFAIEKRLFFLRCLQFQISLEHIGRDSISISKRYLTTATEKERNKSSNFHGWARIGVSSLLSAKLAAADWRVFLSPEMKSNRDRIMGADLMSTKQN